MSHSTGINESTASLKHSETHFGPDRELLTAFIKGLGETQKTLPCRFFYDQRGSALFEKITEQPEYYPTRIEAAILEAKARSIAELTPPGSVLIEYGSGSSRKTQILLENLTSLAAYIPIDVSKSALIDAKLRLNKLFPALNVLPFEGDFTQEITLPPNLSQRPRLGFFPGSTIGNFTPPEAAKLLAKMGTNIRRDGRLILGVDLVKDEQVFVAAYNDKAGVTAAFNLNLLERANREIEADFNLTQFAHEAIFNPDQSRVEMHLVSLRKQIVNIGDCSFTFQEGERIHTENSYKYTVPQFQALAKSAGWLPHEVWTDNRDLFSLHELIYTGPH